MYIYCITNQINGKQYVGQTVRTLEARFEAHRYTNFPIGKAIRKYGKENFTIEKLEDAESYEDMDEKEEYWIKEKESLVPNGYNILDGGKNSKNNGRPVIHLNTMKKYRTIKEASDDTGIIRASINQACRKAIILYKFDIKQEFEYLDYEDLQQVYLKEIIK